MHVSGSRFLIHSYLLWDLKYQGTVISLIVIATGTTNLSMRRDCVTRLALSARTLIEKLISLSRLLFSSHKILPSR